jgi:DHA1 family bicyclomycin/chloramphenicol resistance-like MFS transporter
MNQPYPGRILGLTVLLGLLSMMGPLGIDSFLASIPKIAEGLATTPNVVALSISSLMLGNAVGHLFQGPLSDRFGRKPVILGILTLFTVSAAAAAASASVEALIVWRFFQGTAQSGGRILTAAVARDLFDKERLGKMLADISVVIGTAAILTPIAGGLIAKHLPWQSSLILMAGFGVLVFVLFQLFFHETAAARDPDAINPTVLMRNFVHIGRDRTFQRYTLLSAFLLSGFVAFLSVSSSVIIDAFGVAADRFGFMFASISAFFLVGAFAAGRLVTRLGINRTIAVGTVLAVIGGLLMVGFALAGMRTPEAVFGPMALYVMGFAFVIPQASAGALHPFPTLAGTASTLMGFTQSLFGAVASIGLNLMTHTSALPMAATVLGAAVVSAIIYLVSLARRPPPAG